MEQWHAEQNHLSPDPAPLIRLLVIRSVQVSLQGTVLTWFLRKESLSPPNCHTSFFDIRSSSMWCWWFHNVKFLGSFSLAYQQHSLGPSNSSQQQQQHQPSNSRDGNNVTSGTTTLRSRHRSSHHDGLIKCHYCPKKWADQAVVCFFTCVFCLYANEKLMGSLCLSVRLSICSNVCPLQLPSKSEWILEGWFFRTRRSGIFSLVPMYAYHFPLGLALASECALRSVGKCLIFWANYLLYSVSLHFCRSAVILVTSLCFGWWGSCSLGFLIPTLTYYILP